MDRVEPDARAVAERPDAGPKRRGRRRWLWLTVLGAVVVIALVAVVSGRPSDDKTITRADVNSIAKSVVDNGLEDARSAPADSALAYQAILPSLVIIRADVGGDGQGASDLGTGVVINAAGQILTARHVVADAHAITVMFADGTEAPAKVTSEERDHDIAVLVADKAPEVIVPAVLGSTGGLHVGDETFAVGHPLSLIGSMSAGVISGLNRSIPLADGSMMQGLIQFDAAVNPGNSGGPLLNRAGQVIGIVTSLANPSGQGYFVGIGFAVPIGTATGAAGGPQQ